VAAGASLGEGPLFLVDYLLRLLRVCVLLSLWKVILSGRPATSGMTLSAVLTYTVVAELFGEQLACRAGLEEALWEGTMATRFLRPMGTVEQFVAEACGRWLFSFCAFSIPLVALSPLLGVDPLPASWRAAALFLPSLILAISVGMAIEFIFAALMLQLDIGIWVVGSLRSAVSTLLSGSMLPLALLPWGIGAVFGWLPFASMASAPLRIYTGTGDPVILLPLQAFWAVTLWVAARMMWSKNRERLVSHGG
jgi:ABC-2 type transport system permease protein